MDAQVFRAELLSFIDRMLEGTPDDAESCYGLAVLVSLGDSFNQGNVGGLADAVTKFRGDEDSLLGGDEADLRAMTRALKKLAERAQVSPNREMQVIAMILLTLLSTMHAGNTESFARFIAPFLHNHDATLRRISASLN